MDAGRTSERSNASPDQVRELNEAIDERYRMVDLIAGLTALRFGEALGLHRLDVAIAEGTSRSNRSYNRSKDGALVLTLPKTHP
jgi:hypothetical protein